MSTRLNNEFTVPVPVKQAWDVLLDVERIAPCMPGATLESVEGDTVKGKVRVKVGPITVTYRGEARFTRVDQDARVVVVEASGKEARGSGTASATVTANLTEVDGATRVTVDTDLSVTGRVAQFGRGVMADVSAKLVDRFATNLAAELERTEEPAGETTRSAGEGAASEAKEPEKPSAQVPRPAGAPAAEEPGTTPATGASTSPSVERPGGTQREDTLDLGNLAGSAVLKRALPAAGAAVGAGLVFRWLLRRRRARRGK